jgi:hypothetical protein
VRVCVLTAVVHAHQSGQTKKKMRSCTGPCKQSREIRTLTEAMKARQKCRVAGPTTGCWSKKAACIEEKQRVRRQTAVRCTQKETNNKGIYIYMHTHTHTSVCFSPSVRIRPDGGKHNRTPAEAHTSWYSRHLCHILESVGRHQRDTLGRKIQFTSLRGAGARAHERRTGVVAAEGAAAKGHCPCLGVGRQEMPGCLRVFRQAETLSGHLEAGEPALC